MKEMISSISKSLPDSLISTVAAWVPKYKAINLATGHPEFTTPDALKKKAQESIINDHNQYSISWGAFGLREALSEKFRDYNNFSVDPKKELIITCGTAEAIFIAIHATVNPGDEVIIFEPQFESYFPDVLMARGIPRIIRLNPPDWKIDFKMLEKVFNNSTKAILINTPHNPTGKVYSKEELEFISALCQKWDVIAITDEIYEYFLYDGLKHISIASLPGMQSRTITTGGFSKVFNITGWRVGYCIAPQYITDEMKKLHTYLTVCAPSPFQEALSHIKSIPYDYYGKMIEQYRENRDILFSCLERSGFLPYKPYGAYYMMADFSNIADINDIEFAEFMAKEIGVCAIPQRAFCPGNNSLGRTLENKMLRFCFSRKKETIKKAEERLLKCLTKVKKLK